MLLDALRVCLFEMGMLHCHVVREIEFQSKCAMYSIPTYYTLIHKLSHLIQNQHQSKYHAVEVTTMPLQFS